MHQNLQYNVPIFSVLDDHSRIFLKTTAKDEGGYINANYIEARILS